ncbi:MAG: cbb3-type cytochrome c oxidase subunit 3 [Bdellovibrionaceae bacterium]|nr:cbb3-type cytochrome c oxidase subunit 3 [Pseudobdellovibrionaceae bacterium]
MKQEALAFFQNTGLTAFASVLFFIAFAIILYGVFQKKNRKYYEQMSQLPLEKEQCHER